MSPVRVPQPNVQALSQEQPHREPHSASIVMHPSVEIPEHTYGTREIFSAGAPKAQGADLDHNGSRRAINDPEGNSPKIQVTPFCF